MNNRLFLSWAMALLPCSLFAQIVFTQADTLRGMLRPERTCYDVRHYFLDIEVDPEQRYLRGCLRMRYQTLREFNMLQMDLFDNMQIDSIIHKNKKLDYYRQHQAFFIDFGSMQAEGQMEELAIYYQGSPTMASNPPWGGGFTWKKDENGKHFIGVSCEGIGASLWWPNKDHLSDEPDSMRLRCTVPKGLVCVSNGVLRQTTEMGDKVRYDWAVSYPINNYNVTINIADYVHFSDTFMSKIDGRKLPLDYYVLPYNLAKAKKQFKQVHRVLAVFEKYLDAYPFWNDGYALVETPYLGMEHQSAIAYGNRYMPGYLGRHINGVPDDFIILHETGHEWWGNSLTCNDLAEMWLHEAFTTYMEFVYVEEIYGREKAILYLEADALYVVNQKPILGPKEVNFRFHDTDIYYKGAWMLHTLRLAIDNDALWWSILRGFYHRFKIGHIRTEDFVEYVNKETKQDFSAFFKQYLEYADLPFLVLKIEEKAGKKTLYARWSAKVEDFALPIRFWVSPKQKVRVPLNTREWTEIPLDVVNPDKIRTEEGAYRLMWGS